MRQIVLIGMTGSGKSTVAKTVAKHCDIAVVSAGAIARSMAEEDESTEIALNSGWLAPEAAMRLRVQRELEQAMVLRGGYVLEGFPRSVAQLIALMSWMPNNVPEFYVLDVPYFECIHRLVSRKRTDDNPDSIAKKIESYDTTTQPLIEILGDKAKILSIDAANTSDFFIDTIIG